MGFSKWNWIFAIFPRVLKKMRKSLMRKSSTLIKWDCGRMECFLFIFHYQSFVRNKKKLRVMSSRTDANRYELPSFLSSCFLQKFNPERRKKVSRFIAVFSSLSAIHFAVKWRHDGNWVETLKGLVNEPKQAWNE